MDLQSQEPLKKWCRKCGKETFRQVRGRCKVCAARYSKKYRRDNLEKERMAGRRRWHRTKEGRRVIVREYDKKRIESLTDGYVRALLILRKIDPDPEMIELKRQQIMAIRTQAELRKWISKHN
jgi:hypothetical protein